MDYIMFKGKREELNEMKCESEAKLSILTMQPQHFFMF